MRADRKEYLEPDDPTILVRGLVESLLEQPPRWLELDKTNPRPDKDLLKKENSKALLENRKPIPAGIDPGEIRDFQCAYAKTINTANINFSKIREEIIDFFLEKLDAPYEIEATTEEERPVVIQITNSQSNLQTKLTINSTGITVNNIRFLELKILIFKQIPFNQN